MPETPKPIDFIQVLVGGDQTPEAGSNPDNPKMLRVWPSQLVAIGLLANECRVPPLDYCQPRGRVRTWFDDRKWLAGLRKIVGDDIVDGLVRDGQTTYVHVKVKNGCDETVEVIE